jgi:hypothetical protein
MINLVTNLIMIMMAPFLVASLYDLKLLVSPELLYRYILLHKHPFSFRFKRTLSPLEIPYLSKLFQATPGLAWHTRIRVATIFRAKIRLKLEQSQNKYNLIIIS